MVLGGAVLLTSPAAADSGRVSALYQGYSTSAGQDPYSNSSDVHVGGFGGQPVVTGYVKLDLDSVPYNSTIDGLRLVLTPTGSSSDNVNAAQASIEACPLSSPISSNGYQSNPPSTLCDVVHAAGEVRPDGSWSFELAPVYSRLKGPDRGVGLVAYPPPNGTSAAVAPSAWSVAFAHDRTVAKVDYVPPPPPAGSEASVVAPPPPEAGPGPAPAPLQFIPAPAPPEASPAAPSAAPAAVPAAAPPATLPTVVNQPRVQNQFIWLAVALGAGALLLLVVGAGQQAMRDGRLRLMPALAASRSQLATPLAVLTLAAVVAMGSTTQLVAVVQGGGGSGQAAGGGNQVAGVVPSNGATPVGGGASAIPGTLTAPGGTSSGTVQGVAPGARGSAAVAGQNGPGVTATTIRLGFTYTTNSQAANNAFAIKVADTGDHRAQEQALVDYINKHGGIAGRQIEPVFVGTDTSQTVNDPTAGEEVCRRMTEDNHVFAVFGGGGAPDGDSSNACYAQAGTINFDDQFSPPDLATLRRESPYIWPVTVAAADRTMTWLVAGLSRRGFFSNSASYKLGVVIADDPTNNAVYSKVTEPALHAAGAGNIDTFRVGHGTESAVANGIKQAVVRFQADNVTNVIFQGGGAYGGGGYAVLFMVNAASQSYSPRYGFSSDDAPGALPPSGAVPQSQFHNALAVGVTPLTDTDDAHFGAWPTTPNEKRCDAVEAAAGNTSTSRQGAGPLIGYCNAMFLLQQAAAPLTGGALNAQLWADQAMRLGEGAYNASVYAPYIGPGHWDAAGGYRLLHAVDSCEGSQACFVYDDANVYR